jgi:thiol-disulfide isomerase/thioredoxin
MYLGLLLTLSACKREPLYKGGADSAAPAGDTSPDTAAGDGGGDGADSEPTADDTGPSDSAPPAETGAPGDTSPPIDSALYGVDSDGDGLSDGEELERGSDPEDSDSDDDGYPDGDEVAAGADPTSRCSWPDGGGRWVDFTAEADEALAGETEGWGDWEAPPDLELVDQFGQPFHTRQFHGFVVIIETSAGWCPSCVSEAPVWADLYDEYHNAGECFVWITVITEDELTRPADAAYAAEWAAAMGSAHPVLADPDKLLIASAGERAAEYPSFFILDRDFKVRGWYEGVPNGGADLLRGYINGLL